MKRTALLRRVKRFRRHADGATAVEFALIGPVLVLLTVGIIEIGMILAAQAMLDNATFLGSRTGKTGYKEAGKTQAETISAAIKKAASSYLDPAKITLKNVAYPDYGTIGVPETFTDVNKNGKWDNGEAFVDKNGNGKYDDGKGSAGAGGSSEIVVYTATYNWKLRTPMMSRLIGTNGVLPLSAKAVVKNEPY
jgi:Flp pilus assembly protein TadG